MTPFSYLKKIIFTTILIVTVVFLYSPTYALIGGNSGIGGGGLGNSTIDSGTGSSTSSTVKDQEEKSIFNNTSPSSQNVNNSQSTLDSFAGLTQDAQEVANEVYQPDLAEKVSEYNNMDSFNLEQQKEAQNLIDNNKEYINDLDGKINNLEESFEIVKGLKKEVKENKTESKKYEKIEAKYEKLKRTVGAVKKLENGLNALKDRLEKAQNKDKKREVQAKEPADSLAQSKDPKTSEQKTEDGKRNDDRIRRNRFGTNFSSGRGTSTEGEDKKEKKKTTENETSKENKKETPDSFTERIEDNIISDINDKINSTDFEELKRNRKSLDKELNKILNDMKVRNAEEAKDKLNNKQKVLSHMSKKDNEELRAKYNKIEKKKDKIETLKAKIEEKEKKINRYSKHLKIKKYLKEVVEKEKKGKLSKDERKKIEKILGTKIKNQRYIDIIDQKAVEMLDVLKTVIAKDVKGKFSDNRQGEKAGGNVSKETVVGNMGPNWNSGSSSVSSSESNGGSQKINESGKLRISRYNGGDKFSSSAQNSNSSDNSSTSGSKDSIKKDVGASSKDDGKKVINRRNLSRFGPNGRRTISDKSDKKEKVNSHTTRSIKSNAKPTSSSMEDLKRSVDARQVSENIYEGKTGTSEDKKDNLDNSKDVISNRSSVDNKVSSKIDSIGLSSNSGYNSDEGVISSENRVSGNSQNDTNKLNSDDSNKIKNSDIQTTKKDIEDDFVKSTNSTTASSSNKNKVNSDPSAEKIKEKNKQNSYIKVGKKERGIKNYRKKDSIEREKEGKRKREENSYKNNRTKTKVDTILGKVGKKLFSRELVSKNPKMKKNNGIVSGEAFEYISKVAMGLFGIDSESDTDFASDRRRKMVEKLLKEYREKNIPGFLAGYLTAKIFSVGAKEGNTQFSFVEKGGKKNIGKYMDLIQQGKISEVITKIGENSKNFSTQELVQLCSQSRTSDVFRTTSRETNNKVRKRIFKNIASGLEKVYSPNPLREEKIKRLKRKVKNLTLKESARVEFNSSSSSIPY